MEIIVLAAMVLAALLIRRLAGRENSDVVDQKDIGPTSHQRRPAQERPTTPSPPPTPRESSATHPPPKERPLPAKKWRETTPTPSGRRQEVGTRAARAAALAEQARRNGGLTLKGRAWVVDGDTIVIDKTHIRLAGIDAPELDHPYGQSSKWAMVKLCKGRNITAEIKPEMSYDRVVAVCRLDDGTDLAEALVRRGLALDWKTFSGGRYRPYEPQDARKKLWKTALRQGRAGR